MRTLRSKLLLGNDTRYLIFDTWSKILYYLQLAWTTKPRFVSWLRGFVASWLRGFVASWLRGVVASWLTLLLFVAFCYFLLLFVAFWCFLLLFDAFCCFSFGFTVFSWRGSKNIGKQSVLATLKQKYQKSIGFIAVLFTCKTWTQKSDSRIGFIGVLRKC